MLQPIFDLLLYCWELFVFWYVCPQYNNAVIMRLGNYKRTITSKTGIFKTGLHFLLPFGFDHVLENCILPDTVDLNSQSLTTYDDVNVTLETVVKFRVVNVKKFLLEITDQTAAFADICAGGIALVVTTTTYDHLHKEPVEALKSIHEIIQEQVEKYGLEIQSVTFKTCQKGRTIRLINDSSPMIVTK